MKKAVITFFALFVVSFAANAQYYGYPLEMIFGKKNKDKATLDVKLGDPLYTHPTQQNEPFKQEKREKKKRKKKHNKHSEVNIEAIHAVENSNRMATTLDVFTNFLFTSKKENFDKKEDQPTIVD